MIDLHLHTTYSDGTDSLKDLLKKADNKNIEIISITDHNTCDAYVEMEKYNINDIYKGEIIAGCEFTSSFNKKMIEIIGYGFDYKIINKYLKSYYTKEYYNTINFKITTQIIKKIIELNLICDFENVNIDNGIALGVYDELIKYSENKSKIDENIWDSFSKFYRKGLTNPKSKFFIDYAKYYPDLKDIINLIHESGGKVFLAHPFIYRLENTIDFLNKICDDNKIDGIECFYTTFTNEETEFLIEFCKKRNLLISGGSDYHGLNKTNHEIGVGKGNLNVDKNILNNWNINFYK